MEDITFEAEQIRQQLRNRPVQSREKIIERIQNGLINTGIVKSPDQAAFVILVCALILLVISFFMIFHSVQKPTTGVPQSVIDADIQAMHNVPLYK